jgi:hypothetical protein
MIHGGGGRENLVNTIYIYLGGVLWIFLLYLLNIISWFNYG